MPYGQETEWAYTTPVHPQTHTRAAAAAAAELRSQQH